MEEKNKNYTWGPEEEYYPVETEKDIRTTLMKGDVAFSVKGRKDVFVTGKISKWNTGKKLVNYSEYISKDIFTQMNVNKWGPTCVTLYTFNMLGNKSVGKIKYSDVTILDTEYSKTIEQRNA